MSVDYCYLQHHLGLGDHILCNGLVRYLISKYNIQKMTLATKPSNFFNVKRMFIDRPEILCYLVDNDQQFTDLCSKDKKTPLIRVGFEKCNPIMFDKSFYDSVQIPFIERWNSWHIVRDYIQENKILKALDIKEDYIFVHDESSTGKYNLNIDTNLRQVKPIRLPCEESVFDWIGVIENAKEVHVFNSSFVHLVNSLNLKNKLIYHNIKSRDGIYFILKGDNWRVVNYE